MAERPLICAVADVHVANHRRFGGAREASINRRCRQVLDALHVATERAVRRGARAFIVLGDLFDADDPPPQMITQVQRIFAQCGANEMLPILLVGNHDQTSAVAGDHALGPLSAHALVVDAPRTLVVSASGGDQIELGLIPFRAGAAPAWIEEAAEGLEWAAPGAARVLCIHAGVRDAETPHFLQNASDAVHVADLAAIAQKVHAGQVLAGNWHSRRRWTEAGIEIFQVGALVPTGFDNPGLADYGTLAVLGRDGKMRHEEVPGPRFVKVTSGAELTAVVAQAEAAGYALHVSWEVDPSMLSEAAGVLHQLTELGQIAAGEAVPSETAAKLDARAAADAARAATSLDEALDAFVERMPLDETLDRARVLSLARGYLR